MTDAPKMVKENVSRFDEDVRRTGSYAYTSDKLSSRYAKQRIGRAIANAFPFEGKRVLDLGCGDGAYSLEFFNHGAASVLGIDPAAAAVQSAARRAQAAGLGERAQFEVGNIYDLDAQLAGREFDCVVLCGVLHHLPDPARAVTCAARLAPVMLILEPNGYNPVLKMLERFSRYHVEHEERSFLPGTLRSWVRDAGMRVSASTHLNLVPMLCPDWMARICRLAEPVVERVPGVRELGCGQCLIVAQRA